MRTIINIFILFLLVIILLPASTSGQYMKDSLSIELWEYNGGEKVTLSESILKTIPKEYPKDSRGNNVEVTDIAFISYENVIRLGKLIFTPEEIGELRKYNGLANCTMTSDGKIVGVKFIFSNLNSTKFIEKLTQFARSIREQNYFEISFSDEINQDGYISRSFPVFRTASWGQNKHDYNW